MRVVTICTVVAVLLAGTINGQNLNVRQVPGGSQTSRPRPAVPPPDNPPTPGGAATQQAAAAPKAAPPANVAKASSAKPATAVKPKEDRYLQSLGKITSFMVKLNSFLELTIGTITKQLTDLTTQMADVRGSLDNLVTSSAQPAAPINAKPPPVPDLPAITTPKPKPAPPPAPVRPAPVPRRPAPPPPVQPPPKPVQQPARPLQQPTRPAQRFMPSAYPQQVNRRVANPAPVMQSQQRRVEYYPRQNKQNLRWPGNNEFHPWWQNWWSKNFQGFYPENKQTRARPAQQPQFTPQRPQFGSQNNRFGSSGSNFGSSRSQFGSRNSFGESSLFSVGTSPQFNTGASSQFGMGRSSGGSFPQFGGGGDGGSQFPGMGGIPGMGGMGGLGRMGSMWGSQKKTEAGETEAKGA